ncbi:hypothetical protein L564_0216 [Bordetella pertussis CHLA-15]|nr:hypothetical protein L564_0216 [Bordetella pertussis CHLA-15]
MARTCISSRPETASGARPRPGARCEDSIGCMHGSSEPDLRNWKSRRAVPISRLNLDEYNLLTVHT